MFLFAMSGTTSPRQPQRGLPRTAEARKEPVRAKWPSGRRKRRDYGVTAEEMARRGSVEFEPSFVALKAAVEDACDHQSRWEAQVVAAIDAVVEFTVVDPGAARAVT